MGAGAVFSRIGAAAVRAMLIMVMIAVPSLILPGGSTEGRELVALVALFAAGITLAEYASTYPGLVEFRDAPPFNRLRYLSLLFAVFLLSVIVRGQADPSTFSQFVWAIGTVIGAGMDFPYSPVRLVVLSVAADDGFASLGVIRAAAGMSYLISLLTLGIFVILTRAYMWPNREAPFNVWVNLPTFDPTAGGDVAARLERDARLNIILGFLLPFVTPAIYGAAAQVFMPVVLTSPHTLTWAITLWAFLPASLFMRGIAMGRVAEMIRDKRRQQRIAGRDRALAV